MTTLIVVLPCSGDFSQFWRYIYCRSVCYMDIVCVVQAVARKDGHAVADWTLQFAEDQTCPDPEVWPAPSITFKTMLSKWCCLSMMIRERFFLNICCSYLSDWTEFQAGCWCKVQRVFVCAGNCNQHRRVHDGFVWSDQKASSKHGWGCLHCHGHNSYPWGSLFSPFPSPFLFPDAFLDVLWRWSHTSVNFQK